MWLIAHGVSSKLRFGMIDVANERGLGSGYFFYRTSIRYME